ncbi:hypothetical protein EB796_021933 [Bugula neritina]|uniref:Uncharacterized protein n=1 Tax=Bugula neritina TaxID=10212 RepID=A0A7J7J0U7_BUGNE|nr:hypothetical protein EB796_021933 [Bugula neritina]
MFGSNSVVGLVASSSTNIDAAGTSGVGSVPDAGQSSEAEANKAKRSRAEFEADDNMTAPSTKRQREGENESLPEVDDGTSQDVDTEDDQFSQEDDFASAVSSMQPEGPGHNEASPNVEREPLSETALPVTSDLQQHVVAAEQSQLTMASRAIRQEPTYSGVNADVVIILSSDDEDEAMGQVQTTQHTGEYYSEGESENAEEDVVDEEYGDIEEVEEGMSSSEEVGEEEEPAGESDYDDAEEGDEVADTSDIIVQEELSNHTSHLGMSVSSSQPGTSEGESRRMATLAALNYQAQGTVSVDSNLTEGDGIVPSTPTLAVPISRNDGFAVAVSSPNPSLAPFTFGSSLLPSSEHADLAQQAIIMDDLPRFGDSEAGPMSVDNEVEEPMATTSSQEQSNEVSTESHFELASSTHSPAAAAASTSGVTASEEPVSSSEANNTSTRSVREPIVWQDNSQSSQSDMPSSSSQSRPPVARRGRIRGARLNRPTFNKPQ